MTIKRFLDIMWAVKKTLETYTPTTTTDGDTVGEMENTMKENTMKHYETAATIRAEILAGNATEEARAEYRYIRKTYAAERDALVTMHNKSYSPAETVADLVEAIGYENSAEIIAVMVIAKGTWDERISAKARTWAADLVTLTRDEIADVSAELAQKMLEREINADDHRAMIASFLDEVGDAT